ncbi:hypothetical protein [Devosia ginsengisoli]|uniref:hypothetical protein n=1 Tax=Devosia ginsengisoli TaxID=400770 RepID=UPI0026F2C512|nr:hypothetical protein [Devosia ginsengisoli]MCR6671561.1 hypothetical protein [Devosia ginsengisoli]
MSRKLLAPLAVMLALALAACDSPPADGGTAPPADAAPTDTMAPADPAAPPPA